MFNSKEYFKNITKHFPIKTPSSSNLGIETNFKGVVRTFVRLKVEALFHVSESK